MSAKSERFRRYVETAAQSLAVGAIAEESNEDVERARGESIARHVAESMQPPRHYVPCEPNVYERQALGVSTDFDSNVSDLPESLGISLGEYRDAELLRHFPARERFWIARLGKMSFTSVLFVCGVNHVNTFACRLTEIGIPWRVICFDWWALDDRIHGALPLDEQPI